MSTAKKHSHSSPDNQSGTDETSTSERDAKRQCTDHNHGDGGNFLVSQEASADAQVGIQKINASQKLFASKFPSEQKNHHSNAIDGDVDPTFSKTIANAVWDKFSFLYPDCSTNSTIVAGFAVRTLEKGKDKLRVVALGTGTKCLQCNQYELTGCAVLDCHAEIIARRSFLRWLYRQLDIAGEPQSFAIRSNGKTPFELRPFQLWLYCSQAPCGDAAVYTLNDPKSKAVPCFSPPNNGVFRVKMDRDKIVRFEQKQSLGDIQHGNRSMCHECSDKLGKWFVVGLQGALLTQLIPPLYISGIVVGRVFSHAHIARALCCRSELALKRLGETIPQPFSLHHPRIGHWPLVHGHVRTKRSKYSLNWALGDQTAEIIDAKTGMKDSSGDPSRVSKKALFQEFVRLHENSSPALTYKEAKAQSSEYQKMKSIWVDAMSKTFHTGWCRNPTGLEEFTSL